MKVLFVSSGNNTLNCPIANNQAKSIKNYDNTVEIEHFRVIGKGFLGYIKNIKALKKKILEFNPDIIHSHYSFCGYLSVLATKKIPIIASLMGSDVQINGIWKIVLKYFSKKWKTIIVKSENMRSKSELKNAYVIPNGVNFLNYSPISKLDARNKLNLDKRKIYVLFLANPSRIEKNYELAKESFDLLNNQEAELLVVYNISSEETSLYYYACDVVLMTSKYEGSPNVIKEAMACNKPIVSTQVGDVGLLLNGLDGCFVVGHNAIDISSSLKKAIEFNSITKGKERLMELGIDSDTIARRIISLYNITIGNVNDKTLTNNKICSKGIWDNTIPDISFNDIGESNYCLLQEKMMKNYPRGEEGENQWSNLVSKIKNSNTNKKYNCLIGVSGGVDSSYLLHLAKEYGLNPLAVHLDNGFNSEIAVSNIEKITKILDIDLVTHVINYEEIKDLLRAYMKAGMPWIDFPTDLAIKATMYNAAIEYNIKYILRGNDFRSEGKQPTEWTYSDSKQLKHIHNKFGQTKKLKTYPILTLSKIIYSGLIKKIKDVRPYYFLEYNKDAAKKLLIDRYNWVDYGGHHHENLFTKFAMAYWLPKKFDIDKRKINLSAQILSMAISREDALLKIAEPFDTEYELVRLKDYIIKKLEISNEEFEIIFTNPNKNFRNYPSSYNFIYNNVKHFKKIIRFIYDFKPLSIESSESLNN